MSNITIVEFSGMAIEPRTGARLPYPALPPLAQQVLVLGTTSQQSNAFNPRTHLVSLYAESACRVAIGANPDAAAAGFLLAGGAERTFPVAPGARLAVIDGLPLATPLFSAAPVLASSVAGAPVTWTAAVAAGSTVEYSLLKNGTPVATTSGSYSATVGGDVLQLIATATNGAGGKAAQHAAPVTIPLVQQFAPVIATAPVLAGGGTVGQAITLSPGSVTGTPAPVVTYSWRDAGGNELSNSSSGFTPSAAGQITVVQRAVNAAGDVSRSSNPITVASASVAPAIAAAPVLSAITAGGVVTFTQGTVTGTPTPARSYSLMRGSTVLAANLTSGDTVAGTVADDQVFIRLVASSAGQSPAQSDSNTVVVASSASPLPAGVMRMGGLVVAMDGKPIAIS